MLLRHVHRRPVGSIEPQNHDMRPYEQLRVLGGEILNDVAVARHGGIAKRVVDLPKPRVSGGKITGTPWPQFVREWSKSHKQSYWESIKDSRCSAAYRAQKYK